jgi:hypothetical protein
MRSETIAGYSLLPLIFIAWPALAEVPPNTDSLETVLVSVRLLWAQTFRSHTFPSNVQTLRASQLESDHDETVLTRLTAISPACRLPIQRAILSRRILFRAALQPRRF